MIKSLISGLQHAKPNRSKGLSAVICSIIQQWQRNVFVRGKLLPSSSLYLTQYLTQRTYFGSQFRGKQFCWAWWPNQALSVDRSGARGLLAPMLQIREQRELRQKPSDLITHKACFPETSFLQLGPIS